MLLWAQTTEGACSATPIPATDVLSIGSSVSVLCWEDGRACGIFVRGDADVNGCAALPFHVLDHRDEIRVDGKLYYIGAASPAEPYPFEPADQRILCARCGDEPVAPELVLRCPLCDALHHHDCFDYEPTCGACKRATSCRGRTLAHKGSPRGKMSAARKLKPGRALCAQATTGAA